MMVLDFVKELRLIVNNDHCSVEFHVFVLSTKLKKILIARSNEILGWEGVGNPQLCFFKA
jgi:hypothetical protein